MKPGRNATRIRACAPPPLDARHAGRSRVARRPENPERSHGRKRGRGQRPARDAGLRAPRYGPKPPRTRELYPHNLSACPQGPGQAQRRSRGSELTPRVDPRILEATHLRPPGIPNSAIPYPIALHGHGGVTCRGATPSSRSSSRASPRRPGGILRTSGPGAPNRRGGSCPPGRCLLRARGCDRPCRARLVAAPTAMPSSRDPR